MTMRLFALLSLAGCTDHLLIGAVDRDEEQSTGQALVDAGRQRAPTRMDAGREQAPTRPDASEEAERDAEPMEIALRIFGREDVSMAVANCGAGCTDVEVIVRGGRPPYDVTWADGMRGPRREMCPGFNEFPLQEIVRVNDSSSQSQFLNPVVPLPSGCTADVIEGERWRVCVEPPRADTLRCAVADETWYGLRELVREPQVTIGVSFSVPWFAGTNMELHGASEPCGPLTLLAAADINGFTPNLHADVSTVEAPLQWLVLRAPREADGMPPPGYAPAFSLCFTR